MKYLKFKAAAGKRKRIPIFLLLAAAAFCAVIHVQASQKVQLPVPYISQEGTYATGCELVSAAMVLNYYQCNVTVEQVVKATPRADLLRTKNGLMGEHPSKYFIGDPTSPEGFGCYAPAAAGVMNSFLGRAGHKTAVPLAGEKFEKLLPYINRGDPVLVWATIDMQPSFPGKSWKLNRTGETFQWIAREHCLVLVGYDRDGYYFNDPYHSNGLKRYEKWLVEQRYGELGSQAVVVQGN